MAGEIYFPGDMSPAYAEALRMLDTLPDAKKYAIRPGAKVGMTSNLDDLIARLDQIQLDKTSLNKLKDYSNTAVGESPWAQLMLEKEGVERGARNDEAGRASNAATASAFSALATRGGLSKGARERIATKGASDLMKGRMAVARQGQLDRFNILGEDEKQKLDIMKALPGMDIAALSPELQKTNAWASMADSESGRRMNLDLANRSYMTDIDKYNKGTALDLAKTKYQQQMAAWAADRTATAQENSGKK